MSNPPRMASRRGRFEPRKRLAHRRATPACRRRRVQEPPRPRSASEPAIEGRADQVNPAPEIRTGSPVSSSGIRIVGSTRCDPFPAHGSGSIEGPDAAIGRRNDGKTTELGQRPALPGKHASPHHLAAQVMSGSCCAACPASPRPPLTASHPAASISRGVRRIERLAPMLGSPVGSKMRS